MLRDPLYRIHAVFSCLPSVSHNNVYTRLFPSVFFSLVHELGPVTVMLIPAFSFNSKHAFPSHTLRTVLRTFVIALLYSPGTHIRTICTRCSVRGRDSTRIKRRAGETDASLLPWCHEILCTSHLVLFPSFYFSISWPIVAAVFYYLKNQSFFKPSSIASNGSKYITT